MSCSALYCSSRITLQGVKHPDLLSFHKFPKCPEIKNHWIKALGRGNWEPSTNSMLCSKHFEKSCYIDGLLIKKLKSEAVPTIFEEDVLFTTNGMRAKAPSKLKLRRPTYKCDACPKKFVSTQALKTHQQCVHKIKAADKEPAKAKSKLKALLGKPVKKESGAVTAEGSKPNVRKKNVSRNIDEDSPASDKRSNEFKNVPNVANAEKCTPDIQTGVSCDVEVDFNVSEGKSVEFECPLCPQRFDGYFFAVKHIQQLHRKNIAEESVALDSPDLIKPSQVEQCLKCGQELEPNDTHCCTTDLNLYYSFFCTGCKQTFRSTQLFDLHVAGLHCDATDSLFFTSSNLFYQWKEDMENITKAQYLLLGKSNYKQTYRCTFLPLNFNRERVAYLCPASLVVREFSKGIQVHFYKQHFGHPSPHYEIPDRFKKYTITSLMKKAIVDSNLFEGIDETDLYVQFKTLMDSIVLDAAKLKISALQVLFGKALDMTTLLTSYDAEESEGMPKNTAKQPMTDDQISEALETIKPSRTPKGDGLKLVVKSIEQLNTAAVNTPMILNTFSLANEDLKDTTVDTNVLPQLVETPPVKEKKKEKLKQTVHPQSTLPIIPKQAVHPQSTLPSFNDSYKDFVDKNFTPKVEAKSETPKPNSILRNKLAAPRTPPNKPNLRNTPIPHNAPIPHNTPVPHNTPSIPMSQHDFVPISKTYISVKHTLPSVEKPPIDLTRTPIVSAEENISDVNNLLKVNKRKKSKVVNFASKKISKRTASKKVMKTRIGQFKPSFSAKNNSPRNDSPKDDSAKNDPKTRKSRVSVGSATKVDIKYEVKEQENDCNILILKI